MAALRPAMTVTINGTATDVLEAHTTHSVDAPVAQATLSIPLPLPANVIDGAPVLIEMGLEGDLETVFQGRIRGPVERGLSESDTTASIRCDGNLWRAAFPRLRDLSFPGPISPRQVIRSILTLHGVTNIRLERFVHPVTGVPLLLGGVPWFDLGRVILTAGTSPLALCERIAKLFGYRVFDWSDGSVRVMRISGAPHAADFALEEGVDVLGVTRSHDLHELVTQWTAEGASGTDPAGQEIAVVSRPVGGITSPFIPAPPTYVAGTVSDSLLVTQQLANAARMAAEYDYGGVAYRVRVEAPGQKRYTNGEAAKFTFGLTAPSVGLATETTFWLTGVTRDFTSAGYWVTYEGWRPGGRPVSTAANPPIPPTLDTDTNVDAPPPESYADPDVPYPTILDGDDPLIPYGNADGDLAPVALEDPLFDPEVDPDGADVPPDDGDVDVCEEPAAAPPRQCLLEDLLESYDEQTALDGTPVVLSFMPAVAYAEVTVRGETNQPGGAVEIWQSASMLGSEPIPDPDPGVWTAFEVTVTAAIVAEIEAEVQITYTEPV